MASTFIHLPTLTVAGPIEVDVSASNDSIKISDGVDTLAVNPDGSLNVVVSASGAASINTFGEVSAVASGVQTNIVSYTVVSSGYLSQVTVAGTQTAKYEVLVNGNVVDRLYTAVGGELSREFPFGKGIPVVGGDAVVVRVRHDRTGSGDFNARVQTLEG